MLQLTYMYLLLRMRMRRTYEHLWLCVCAGMLIFLVWLHGCCFHAYFWLYFQKDNWSLISLYMLLLLYFIYFLLLCALLARVSDRPYVIAEVVGVDLNLIFSPLLLCPPAVMNIIIYFIHMYVQSCHVMLCCAELCCAMLVTDDVAGSFLFPFFNIPLQQLLPVLLAYLRINYLSFPDNIFQIHV